jgi:hypothetical protein
MPVHDDAGAEEGGGVVVGWDKGKGRQGEGVTRRGETRGQETRRGAKWRGEMG